MISTLLAIGLVINELMASNAGQVMSPATNFDSWIELYNPGTTAINLNGMYLSDDPEHLQKWRIPSTLGSVMPQGYKVIWMGSDDIKTTQATFHLDCDGGTIYLSDRNGQLMISQNYPEAKSRTSYARKTDGGEQWGWTATPTPEATNATAVFASQQLDAPVVDQGSQLFGGTLKVTVEVPAGATLMYTTDGSTPIATEGTQSKRSKDGVFYFDRTTSLTVRLYREGYLPSVPVVRSYIKDSKNFTIPVVSVVGDPKYFTDPMWGIDVDGKNGEPGNGRNDNVNWNRPWDRPVNFSYISPTEGMLFNQDVNISVSGGWTRSLNPRSMKLKANKVFDGQNRMDYVFFPQKPYIRNKVLLIRNGGNDVWEHHARFMDPALETIIQRSGIDIDVQSFVQVAEYINGKFKGILNLREPNNDKFVYANQGLDDDEIDMFENFYLTNGNDKALQHLYNLGDHISDDGAYDEVKELLDVDEFCNYMAEELFLGNNDWPDNNIKVYRSQANGRFRFVSYDLDYSFKRDNPWADLDNYAHMPFIRFFKNLLTIKEFRKKMIDTSCIIAGSVFEKERASAIVDELANAMRPMSALDGHLPDNAARKIKSQLQTRGANMMMAMRNYSPLKLSNVRKQSVSLKANVAGARLFINNIEVPQASFNGELFRGIVFNAKAPAGYLFKGWRKEGADKYASTAPEMSMPLDQPLHLTAEFEPMTAEQKEREGITPVRINEVSAANGIYQNEYFKRSDWLELYNTTNSPIDVKGMYLSDDPENPKKYQIANGGNPVKTIIGPHGHLIVWCDKLEDKEQLHASFKLDADGGEVVLTTADESWTDRLRYTAHNAQQTVGRYPDGTAEVYVMNVPSIERNNLTSSYVALVEQQGTSGIDDVTADQPHELSMRYLLGRLIIRSKVDGPLSIRITDLAGQSMTTLHTVIEDGYSEFSVGQLPVGIYLANVTDKAGNRVTIKFIKGN